MLCSTTSAPLPALFFFFFNDTATPEIYTLSLHDALPICWMVRHSSASAWMPISRSSLTECCVGLVLISPAEAMRSEEHTSELQSLAYLVCRLLLEKKKDHKTKHLFRSDQRSGGVTVRVAV